MDLQLSHILENITEVHTDRQYWFIRTDAGYYYNTFISRGVVGIGFDKITLNIITEVISDNTVNSAKKLTDIVRSKYPDISRPGLAASQLLKFFTEIKKGDVVIIPSVSSSEISFGIIQDSEPFSTSFLGADQNKDLTYNKARNVTWVKHVHRKKLNPRLFSLFFSHQTISNGSEYASYIDSTINDFYKKEDRTHLQLSIQKSSDINARALFTGCIGLLDLTDDFMKQTGYDADTKNIDVKISLNSPGFIEFIGNNSNAMVLLGFIIVGVVGGGFTAKISTATFALKTDGIIKKISDFLKEKHRQETLSSVMDSLEAADPKDIIEIAKKLIK